MHRFIIREEINTMDASFIIDRQNNCIEEFKDNYSNKKKSMI